MDSDWWARGIAITALSISLLAAAWPIFAWSEARRVRLQVTASMSQFWPAMHPGQFVAVDELKPEGYLLDIRVLNRGRPTTVDSGRGLDAVGLLDSQSGALYGFIQHPAQFPARLQPQEALNISGSPGSDLREALRSGARLIPYCRGSDGRIHKGKYDEYFHKEAQRLLAEYPDMKE